MTPLSYRYTLLTVCLLLAFLSEVNAFKTQVITRSSSATSHSPLFAGPRFDRNARTFAPPPPINQYIKAREVRLIIPREDEAGVEIDDMIGVLSIQEAQEQADNLGLDLVLINDNADPPICKIIDYGKWKYEAEKKKKENAKKQIKGDMKEVKMSYKIDQNDFDVRRKRVQKFIGEGDRVRFRF